MTDIKLQWIDTQADVQVSVDDLLADDGLQTSIILSLFCDARATDDELPDGETQRRGWWADQFSSESNDTTGSKLWMLWREKRVPETLRRAQHYCEQALKWMKDDGVASAVSVATSFASVAELTGNGRSQEYALLIEVAVTKPTGTKEAFKFAYQWQQNVLLGA